MKNITVVHEVTGSAFYEIVKNIILMGQRGAFLTHYDVEDYEKMRKTVVLNDKSAGICVKEDGDVVSVFKSYDENNYLENALDSLMPIALINGGSKLDCFGEYLTRRYIEHGFVPVAKCKFSEEDAPKNWDFDKFGKPDIYFMCRFTKDLDKLVSTLKYLKKSENVLKQVDDFLPYFTYDQALNYRNSVLEYLNNNELGYNEVVTLLRNGSFLPLDKNR